ncbi:MAG: hypothetical protein MUP13_07315 [Thermoanaerobaculales bacterium]|nr:hypothetical protein [Thermoanaerobaculales bacterium]
MPLLADSSMVLCPSPGTGSAGVVFRLAVIVTVDEWLPPSTTVTVMVIDPAAGVVTVARVPSVGTPSTVIVVVNGAIPLLASTTIVVVSGRVAVRFGELPSVPIHRPALS